MALIVTPEKSILDEDASQVTVPAHDGEVGIQPGHAWFLARLGIGELRVESDGRTRRLFVEGGFVQVSGDKVTVLTDAASEMQDIDPEAASKLVDELRGQGRGEAFADATHRHLVMKRVKANFESS